MSAITDLVGGIISGLGDTAVKIRTAITGIDPTKQAEIAELTMNLQAQASKLENDTIIAQTEIDKQEAASTNIFVAGWRPAVGWACAIAFGVNFLLLPIAQWVVQLFGVLGADGKPLMLFRLDLTTMLPVLLGMLGLGAYRTVEKINGSQGNH
ncbi:MAG: holin family protein [Acidobacteriia bacterium]|nr:holin family protein [Terriglobia bacterium]